MNEKMIAIQLTEEQAENFELEADVFPHHLLHSDSMTSFVLHQIKEQRDSFARQQEERPKINMFYGGTDGEIFFGNGTVSGRKSVGAELNRMRTELARLSQLLPKE